MSHVLRAFGLYFLLANLAEDDWAERRRRREPPGPDSFEACLCNAR